MGSQNQALTRRVHMTSRRISFAAIFTCLVPVLAWAVLKWTGTPAATGPGPAVALTGTRAATEPGPDTMDVLAQGKELFTREWIAGDRRSHAGDGLGPVYNAQSCAACHRLGGIGGAGNNETNVSLVTVFVSQKWEGAIVGVLLDQPLPPADARKKVLVA